jgi:hypothetical protein
MKIYPSDIKKTILDIMKEQRKQKAHTCGVISLLYLIE